MGKLKDALVKYAFGRDINDYYANKRAFYREFNTSDELSIAQDEQIRLEEVDHKFWCSYIPNAFHAAGIVAAVVTRDPNFFYVNALAESLRWAGRRGYKISIKLDKIERKYIIESEQRSQSSLEESTTLNDVWDKDDNSDIDNGFEGLTPLN
jgi:hypothetical protein